LDSAVVGRVVASSLPSRSDGFSGDMRTPGEAGCQLSGRQEETSEVGGRRLGHHLASRPS